MVLDKHDNDDGGICFLINSFWLYPLKKNDFSPHARKILRHSILVWRSSIMNHRLDIGPARTCTKSPDSYVCKHNISIYFSVVNMTAVQKWLSATYPTMGNCWKCQRRFLPCIDFRPTKHRIFLKKWILGNIFDASLWPARLFQKYTKLSKLYDKYILRHHLAVHRRSEML